jgi:hypothetical protein
MKIRLEYKYNFLLKRFLKVVFDKFTLSFVTNSFYFSFKIMLVMVMLAIMHMLGSMFDGHHPFPWLLCMPFYKSKWNYVYNQRVLSLV